MAGAAATVVRGAEEVNGVVTHRAEVAAVIHARDRRGRAVDLGAAAVAAEIKTPETAMTEREVAKRAAEIAAAAVIAALPEMALTKMEAETAAAEEGETAAIAELVPIEMAETEIAELERVTATVALSTTRIRTEAIKTTMTRLVAMMDIKRTAIEMGREVMARMAKTEITTKIGVRPGIEAIMAETMADEAMRR